MLVLHVILTFGNIVLTWTLGWFKSTLLFQNQEGTPKFVQIHEKTALKNFQLDQLRIGRANPLISFTGVLAAFFWGGGQNNINDNNF